METLWACLLTAAVTLGARFLSRRRCVGDAMAAQLQRLGTVSMIFLVLICGATWARQSGPSVPPATDGFARLFPGVERLKFHEITRPPGKPCDTVVLIGGSNIASWGADYRWSARNGWKYDYWGRASIAHLLERQLRWHGPELKVYNLALNGSSLRDDFFMFLWAVENRPDAILYGINAVGLLHGGGFASLPAMNTGLEQMLARQIPSGNRDRHRRFVEHLRQQPHAAFETRPCSWWDLLVFRAGQLLQRAYHTIGLPPLVVKTREPDPGLLESMRNVNADEIALFLDRYHAAMKTPVADALPLMAAIARARGIRFEAFLAPDKFPVDRALQAEYRQALEADGIPVFDLTLLDTPVGAETFDGVHHNLHGNARIARELARHYWRDLP